MEVRGAIRKKKGESIVYCHEVAIESGEESRVVYRTLDQLRDKTHVVKRVYEYLLKNYTYSKEVRDRESKTLLSKDKECSSLPTLARDFSEAYIWRQLKTTA